MTLTSGFQALAYPAYNLSGRPCPCSLVFRCDAISKKATLLLTATTSTAHGCIVLQYDADNLQPGCVGLSNGTQLDHEELDELLRDKSNKRSDIKTLTLSTHKPCPVWSSAQPSGPNSLHSFNSLRLGSLAMETKIHVVFEYKHLLKEHQGLFKAFSKAAKGLIGYPVEQFLTEHGLTRTHGMREADPTVIGPAKADDDMFEPPPLYSNVVGKRHQQEMRSPSRASPPCKRICVTPQPETAFPVDAYLGSTTEEATTTTAFPSPLRPSLDAHEAIDNILETKISHVLHKILPGVLKDILDSKSKVDAPPSIGAQITERVIADAQPQIAKLVRKIEEDASEHKEQLHRDAQAELDSDVSDYKYDIKILKDETLEEIRHETEIMTNEFLKAADETKQGLIEELAVIVDDFFLHSDDRLKDTMEEVQMALQRSAIMLKGNSSMRGEFWYIGPNVRPTRITQRGLRGILLKQTLAQVIRMGDNDIASPIESKAGVRRRAESLPPL